MRNTLAALKIPDYRRLFISNGLWWMFTWTEQLVSGWLALELTDSAWKVALVGFFRMGPLLLVGLVSGAIADRFGRRRIILISQTVNIIIPLILCLLVLTDLIQYWHIPFTSVILGIFWALDWPARRSILPDVVGRERITDGILLEGVLQNIVRIVGPLSAGMIVQYFGISGFFAAIAVISGIGLVTLLGLSKPPKRAETTQDAIRRTSFADFMRYIVGNQTILGVLLITIAMNFLFFPHMTLLPVFARDVLGQGSVGLGTLGTGYGIGTFIGLLVLSRIRRIWRSNWIYLVGSIYQSAILIPFALSASFPLSVVMLSLAGLGGASFAVLQSSIVLESASDEMRGRTMGILNLSIGFGALGRVQMGAVASALGAPAALAISCAVAVVLIVGITAMLPGFRKKS